MRASTRFGNQRRYAIRGGRHAARASQDIKLLQNAMMASSSRLERLPPRHGERAESGQISDW
jgi:hypothetical protein